DSARRRVGGCAPVPLLGDARTEPPVKLVAAPSMSAAQALSTRPIRGVAMGEIEPLAVHEILRVHDPEYVDACGVRSTE
ncbi:MAG TPA: hypothetical protein VE666_01395, partial [Mycobacterium sp.]|nr:hypothetical protein [Mycobacterium sp.]